MPLPADNNLLSVSKASSLLEVSSDTLRRLDKKGQVTPKRGPNGERLYSADDISLLKQVLKKPVGERSYGIQEAANILRVSPQTIRRWEREGKIATSRTPGGTRFFTLKDIQTLQNLPRTVQTQTPVTAPQMPVPTLQIPTPVPQMPAPVPQTPAPVEKPVGIPIPILPFPMPGFGTSIPKKNEESAYQSVHLEDSKPFVVKKHKNYLPYVIIIILILLLGSTVAYISRQTYLKSIASNSIEANLPIPSPSASPSTNNPAQQVATIISNAFKIGSIIFQGADNQLAEDNNNLFWDATNAFLGIGTNLPNARLTVSGGVTGASLVELIGQNSNNILSATSGGQQVFNIDHAGNTQIAGALSDINDSSLNVLQNLAVGGDLTVAGGDITSSNDLRIYSTKSTTLGSSSSPTTINGKDITISSANNVYFKNSVLTNSIKLSNTATALPNGNTGIVDAIVDAWNHGGSGGTDEWSSAASVVYPNSTTDNLAIGGTTAAAPFYVTASSGNITTAGDLAVNGGDITSTGNLTITPAGGTTNVVGVLNVSGLTASKPVFTDASKNLTSTGTVGTDQGGTGFSSYTVGDILYADTTSTLARLNDVATGNVLISGGAGVSPSWNKVILGTHTTGNYVASISGTPNQITASNSIGDVTLSIPSDFRAPGTVNAVSGLYTGATAGTERIDSTGNLVNIGNITGMGAITVTPGAGNNLNIVLSGTGDLAVNTNQLFVDTSADRVGIGTTTPAEKLDVQGNILSSSLTSAGNRCVYADLNGVLRIKTDDCGLAGAGGDDLGNHTATQNILLNNNWLSNDGDSEGIRIDNAGNVGIGTASPTALLDVAGNASVSGALTFRNGTGTIQTTAFNPLVIGGNTTGNITFNPSNAAAGGFVAPNTTNVTDLGTSSLLWRNIYGTSIYQGVNQVCDAGGSIPGCGGTSYWEQVDGVLYPINNTVDLLIGSNATSSAKFAFTGVNSGTPTASISGTTAGVATYLTGNGNLAVTNMSHLTIGGAATGGVDFGSPITSGTWNGSTIAANYGGTGFSSYAIGDMLYADTTSTLARLNDVAVGNVLISGGAGVAPSWNKVILGTHTTGNYVATIAGTANQITASTSTGNITLSIPSDFRAPGTINAVSGLYTGATAGTQRIDASGNLTNIGTTQLNGVTYTWPAAATANYVLQSTGTGTSSTLAWVDPAAAIASNIYWTQANGVLFPKNNSVDVLIGSDSTTSAKFAFTGVNGGLPTASIAGDIAGVATYLTGDGNLAVTNMAHLTLGGATTGMVDVSNDLNLASGKAYYINGTSVLNNNTLGTGVLTSSLTTVGILNAGSITNGFGAIDTGADNIITTGTMGVAANTAFTGLSQTLTGQFTSSYANAAAINLTGAGAGITFTGTGANQITTAASQHLALMPGGSVGIGTTTPTALLDVAGNASVSGTLAFRAGTGTIQTTAFNPLVIGGSTTGNITLDPSNHIAGGFVAPNTTNVTDLGTSTLLWRNIYGTSIYQGVNQVCDAGGIGCPAGALLWEQTAGAIYPVNNTVDLLIGSNATSSAAFAFKNVLTGTPTASISGNSGSIATYLTGDGTLATTNRQDLSLGNSATYNTTGNILLNPNGTGNVGIGTTSPGYTLDVSGDLNVTGTVGLGLRTPIANALINMEKTYPDTNNSATYGILSIVNITPSTMSFNQPNGIYSRIDLENTAWINDTAYAIQGIALGNANDANAKINAVYAAQFYTYFTNADVYNATSAGSLYLPNTDAEDGTIGSAYSINAFTPTVDTGDITSAAYGLRLQDGAAIGVGGTIANLYPIYIDADARTVTTNKYGLYMGTMSGGSAGNNYQLYIAGTADSYFAGDIIAQKIVDTSSSTYYLDPASGTTSLYINGGITSNNGTAFNIDSVSNKPIYLDAGSGTVFIGAAGAGKLDAGTIDPPYTIDGEKYATYQPSMTGVKEETTGIVSTSEYVPGIGYRSVIDFGQALTGSDIWLFSKVTNLTQNFDKLVVLLSPSSNTKSWYGFDSSGKLSIYTSRPTSVSYRLTAPRFDFTDWKNTRNSENAGFLVPNSTDWPISVNLDNSGGIGLDNLAIETATGSASIAKKYNLIDTTSGQIIDELATFSEAMIANLRSGLIIAKEVTTDSFIAFQGTIDNLLVRSGLVTANIQTKLISPLADGTNVTVKIGSDATPSGKFAIQNAQGTEVAAIDNAGNATFAGTVNSQELSVNSASVSGTLYADAIKSKSLDDIQALLTSVQTDQNLLKDAANWNVLTATDSASLTAIATADLYVTNQAAVNSLSVTNSLALGSDMVLGSAGNNIDSLSAPLKIQSLAMAPLEIMAGLVTIDTHGNVNIAGNLYVAGRIHSSGLTLQGTTLQGADATASASLLSLQNDQGAIVASIDASGSAIFTNIQTQKITGTDEDRGSVEFLPAEDSKVIQRQWTSTPAAVLVSPSYKTQAWVTDTSENGFTIRVSDSPIDSTGKIFWWALW